MTHRRTGQWRRRRHEATALREAWAAGNAVRTFRDLQVQAQGKAVVERNDAGEILVMAPDGTVTIAADAAAAAQQLDRWASRSLGRGLKIGVMQVDWRGVTPPERGN